MTNNISQDGGSMPTDLPSRVRLDGVFRKSSLSGSGGCVSVAKFGDGSVKVQDTKDPERKTTLAYTKEEWLAFLEGVKRGEFDVES